MAIDMRHSYIEQQYVKALIVQAAYSFLAADGGGALIPMQFKEFFQALAETRLVVHDQYPDFLLGRM
jgi:hypothetical protein